MLSASAAEKLFISNPEKLPPQNKQKNRTHIRISAESIALVWNVLLIFSFSGKTNQEQLTNEQATCGKKSSSLASPRVNNPSQQSNEQCEDVLRG